MNGSVWIFAGLMVAVVVITDAEEVRMSTYFPEFVDDPSDISWVHAVNTREALRMAFEGDAHMIEADVSLGTVAEGRGDEGPVMGHPPLTKAVDVDLRDWLGELVSLKKAAKDRQGRSRRLGVKLDFKSFDIVMSAFQIVTDFFDEIDFPIWFNADILPGPVNATQEPVTSFLFLHVCNAYFPDSIASVGWTTALDADVASSKKTNHRYEWDHVISMAALLHKVNTSQSRTFPVRAAFVGRSIDRFSWLLGVVPDSTLTVWSAAEDDVDVNDLLALRNAVPKSKVYYDLPKRLDAEFRLVKNRKQLADVRQAKDAAAAASRPSVSECILQSGLTLAFIKPCNNTIDLTGWPSSRGLVRGTMEFLMASEGRQQQTGGDDDGQSFVFGVAGHQLLVERTGLVHEVRASSIVNTTRLARSRCYAFQMDVSHLPAALMHLRLWSVDCAEDERPCPPDVDQGVFFADLGDEGAAVGGSISDDFGGLLVLNVESRGDRFKVMRSLPRGHDCHGDEDGKLQLESTATAIHLIGSVVVVFHILMLLPLLFVDN